MNAIKSWWQRRVERVEREKRFIEAVDYLKDNERKIGLAVEQGNLAAIKFQWDAALFSLAWDSEIAQAKFVDCVNEYRRAEQKKAQVALEGEAE